MRTSIAMLALLLAGLPAQQKEIDDLAAKARGGDHAALTALGKKGEAAVPALVAILHDRDVNGVTRYLSANALGATRSAKAFDPLVKALGDPYFNIRRCAAGALATIGDKRAIPHLQRLARTDRFTWVDRNTGKKMWLVRDDANAALKKLGAEPIPLPKPAPPPPVHTGTPYSDTLPWADTVEEALARARKENKLVVATVVPVTDGCWMAGFERAKDMTAGLFPHRMGNRYAVHSDSGLVKERVMMATIFGDAFVVETIREHAIPVRIRLHAVYYDQRDHPKWDPLRQLGTDVATVSGPSLVIATADGKLLHAVRRIGTFAPRIFGSALEKVLTDAGRKVGKRPVPSEHMRKVRRLARGGRNAEALGLLVGNDGAPPDTAEAWYLLGELEHRLGQNDSAESAFEKARDMDPKGPWGSRALLRLAEDGPVLEAWETPVFFPHSPPATTTEKPMPPDQRGHIARRAVQLLLAMQRGDGSWPDPYVSNHPMAKRTGNWNQAVSRTGIVTSALIAWRQRLPLYGRIDETIRGGIDFVGAYADRPRQGQVWQLTYALHLQVAILDSTLFGEDEKLVAKRRARTLLHALRRDQADGGWSYMPAPRIHSFNTAPVLMMLADLKRLGVRVPTGMAEEAVALIESCRRKEEPREFAYAKNIRHDHLGSSSCRTALCELALLMHSGKGEERLTPAIELFLEWEPQVRITTKVFESYFSPTPMHDAYHHLFGHYYTSRAIAALPKEKARPFAKRQLAMLAEQVEIDGGFVDAQMQGKAYSTGMALLALDQIARLIE